MLRISELKLPLGHPPEAMAPALAPRRGTEVDYLVSFAVARRAHDARRKSAILMVYSVDVVLRDEAAVLSRFEGDHQVRVTPDTDYRFVAKAPAGFEGPRPVVIGAGPCGLLAGLILAQLRPKPINVEGRKVLEEFVKAGAPEEILTEAHPHIGTFRLVHMVENMRALIESLGGEYRWQHKVEDFDIEVGADGSRRLKGLHIAGGDYLPARHVVMALGHSARDTFQVLYDRGVHIEAKPFSIGVRIEHPQSWIDRARFGDCAGHPDLGAADYSLSHHCKNGRTVYSFCMCPGGTVVAATSEPGRVVTNGMSQYSRNERNANSG